MSDFVCMERKYCYTISRLYYNFQHSLRMRAQLHSPSSSCYCDPALNISVTFSGSLMLLYDPSDGRVV